MANFVFDEILVWSSLERKAKRVRFHPQLTVIEGANHTGKSSLLKSLVGTFGAEPATVHRAWRRIEPHTLVRFTVHGKSYAMLRYGNGYAAFDGDGRLLRVFKRITSELGPFLAEMVGFGLRLPDRQGRETIPPPAYLFLPFYIDQDVSWGRAWETFEGLRQFARWRQPLTEYFTGIKDNAYYSALAERESAARELEEAQREYSALKSAHARLRTQLGPETFELDAEAFEIELQQLVERCQELNRREEKYKADFLHIENARLTVLAQLDVVEGSLEEISADYRYATERLDDRVECPTCGAKYENGFAERFRLALEEDRCRELVGQLHGERNELDRQLTELQTGLEGVRLQAATLNELLTHQKGEVVLRDVIKAEGRKEVREVFEENLRQSQRKVREQEGRLNDLRKRLRKLNHLAKERQRMVEEFYRDRMKQYLYALDVQSLAEPEYKSIWANIKETGSNTPRALLAYYYAILHTIRKYSRSPFLPIVIDSPNQQAQDAVHLEAMLEFIFERQPENSQMIVSLEDLRGAEVDGTFITLEGRGLLRHDEYEVISDAVRPYTKQFIDAL